MLLRFVNRRFCREALGTSATLYTVCSHCDIAGITRGIGLSTSPFRRCSFTPHPPIRLRTQLLCVRKLYNPTMGFVALLARRSAAVSHSGHRGGTVRTGSVIKMPVGLALPFGSADHWVGEVPCPGPGA